jgi:hypothetical protein
MLDLLLKFKAWFVGAGIILVLALGAFLWHAGQVSGFEDRINKEWADRIANAKPETTVVKKPYYIKLRDTSGVAAARLAISAKFDSAARVWEAANANKDSLLAYYTQDAATTIKPDTIKSEMDIIFMPLAPLAERFKYDWRPGKIRAESVQVNIGKLVPMPVPWYESGTAYFVYGAVASGVAVLLIGK